MKNTLILFCVAVTLCLLSYIALDSRPSNAHIKYCPNSKFNNGPYFSQFYEDYILADVFSGVAKGFYIDVGANDPNKNNATKYFHDIGWHGMNIEPQKYFYDMLVDSRPNAMNYNLAVSDKQGTLAFYIPDNSKPCASLERSNSGLADNVQQTKVRVTTLNNLLDQNKITNIDILKIDVEGHEYAVLNGIDLKKFRPKVIVIEVISPNDFHGYLKSEPILLANGYILGMSDELNRYYYPKEHQEYAKKFANINKCVVADKVKRNAFCPNKENCRL